MAEPGLNSRTDLISEHRAALIGRDPTGYFWHLRQATQEVVWWAIAALPAPADVQELHWPSGLFCLRSSSLIVSVSPSGDITGWGRPNPVSLI